MVKKFILLSFCAFALAAQEIPFPANFTGWVRSNPGKIQADKEVKISKDHSLRMEDNSTAIATVNLEKGKKYMLRFSVKGEELEGGTRIVVNSPGVNRWYPVSSFPDKRLEKGTFDWRKGSGLLDPAVLGGTKVSIHFKNYGKGKVWYDAIRLEEINSELPDGWKNVYATPVAIDKEVKVSDASIRMENFGRIEKLFDLEDDAEYELSFYMKGENIKGSKKDGAQVLICGADRKAWARANTNTKGEPEQGTFDWKKGTRRFTGKYFKSNKVYIMPSISGSGTVWFDKIELKKLNDKKGKTSFRSINSKDIRNAAFFPGGVSGFFTPGERITLSLVLEGRGSYTASVKVRNYSTGKEICPQLTGSLTAPGKAEFTLPGQKNGYYVAEAEIFQDKKKIGRIQCGITVAPEFSKRDPFFQFGFGVYNELHDAYKRTGAGAIAFKLKSMEMGDRDPVKYVDKQLQGYQNFLDSGAFKLLFSLGATLRRHSDPVLYASGRPVLTDHFVDSIIKGVTHAAQQTKGKVKEWCVGSEIPSQAQMPRYAGTWTEAMFNTMTIVRMASRIIKKTDPSIKVFWGGNNVQRFIQKIERIVFEDLEKDVDGYFIDAYTGNWDMTKGGYSSPEQSLRSFYAESSELSESMGKGKFIKNDETGYAINYGSPYDGGLAVPQAELTTRTIILTKTAPVLCFELHMPVYHPWNLKSFKDNDVLMATIWKTVISNGKYQEVPLPGSAAYTTAAHKLSFAKFSREVVSGMNYACIFRKENGKIVTALWNTESKVDLEITLSTPTVLTDMVGFEKTLAPGKNKITISTAPVYLENTDAPAKLADMLKKSFSAAAPPLTGAAKRCSQDSMTLFIQNPGGDLADVTVKGDGKVVRTVKAAPGISTHKVPVSGKLEIASGGRVLPIGQDKTFIRVNKLNKKPVFDGSGKWLKGLTVNKLSYPDDIYPREALQPERSYFKTSFNPNGHNFSAEYYLAYDRDNLYIAVKADDREHLNRVANSYLWEGDSIQWVLSGKDIPPAAIRPTTMKQQDYISLDNYGLALTGKGIRYCKHLGKNGFRNFPANVTRKDGITFYEVAVPWSDTGITPFAGQSVRFSLVIFNKVKEADAGSAYYLALTPGVAGGMDAGCYRLLIFDK